MKRVLTLLLSTVYIFGVFLINPCIVTADDGEEWYDLTSSIEWVDGHWNTYGNYSETTNVLYTAWKYSCSNIAVKDGETYRVTCGWTGGADATVLFLDKIASATYVQNNILGYNQISESTEIVTVPENAHYMCISTYTDSIPKFKLEKLASNELGEQKNERKISYNNNGNTYLTITIDDTNGNIDDIERVFSQHNMPANYATQPSRLNEPTTTTKEAKKDVLLRAQEKGSEILGHDYRVISSSVSREDTIAWYGEVKEKLTEAGFNVNGFIMTGGTGQNTANYKDLIDAMVNNDYIYGDLQAAGYDIVDYKQYYNPRVFNDCADWADVHIKGVEKIKTTGGGWYNLGTHMNNANVTVDELDKLLTWCEENDVQVVTWNYIIKNCTDLSEKDICNHNRVISTTDSTCSCEGSKIYTCTRCGNTYTQVIEKAEHTLVTETVVEKAATQTEDGFIRTDTYCKNCDYKKQGEKIRVPKISAIELQKTTFGYNWYYTGKVITPKITVKDSTGKALINGTDYTLTYSSGRKNVGRYNIKVTFKGKYSGTKTFTFDIVPRATKITSIAGRDKGFTVWWNNNIAQATGYQIQFSTASDMRNAKSVTISKKTNYARRVKGRLANKKYYVRMRTYSRVMYNGKYINVYSPWSAAKAVRTK